MKRFCSKACEVVGAVCDFCIFYDFNGDDDGCYTGDGYCRFHQKQIDPEEGCADFICFRVKDKENK